MSSKQQRTPTPCQYSGKHYAANVRATTTVPYPYPGIGDIPACQECKELASRVAEAQTARAD